MENRAKRTVPRSDMSFRIGDCYVWSQIHYLDSATDYREALPGQPVKSPCMETRGLVMLDSASVSWSGVVAFLLVILAGVAGFSGLVYLALTGE